MTGKFVGEISTTAAPALKTLLIGSWPFNSRGVKIRITTKKNALVMVCLDGE
jgi:hypothetical protein